ncbi:unnamed protein product [Somion occarium]|uniref:General stress protein FMN-binding split barrel domain-containing protein n=1 Tax=Somion occarium TaxID=3059160 RepID=A0ABP1DJ41_9APHY
MSSSDSVPRPHDAYSTKAKKPTNITPQEKVKALHDIVKRARVGMLTTRNAEGSFHSRAMAPTGPITPYQTHLVFLANNASRKFEEIQNDAHVNVSFCDEKTTSWASYTGIARVSQDKEKISKHWGVGTSIWFGDLGDGIHKGNREDPRVTIIEVIPESIRYWIPAPSKAGRIADIVTSAATGQAATPGRLNTITKEEIEVLRELDAKNVKEVKQKGAKQTPAKEAEQTPAKEAEQAPAQEAEHAPAKEEQKVQA